MAEGRAAPYTLRPSSIADTRRRVAPAPPRSSNLLVKRILVGLGNPGPEYVGTRHNVGFEVLDRVALHEGLLFRSPASLIRSGALDGYGGERSFLCARSFDPDVLLVKPTTFMNLSGEAVSPIVQWAGVTPADVLVVYDDMDLPLGRLRMRPSGGHGGQNGMRSIIDALGSNLFPRLRIGIGRTSTDAARHVLSRFNDDERIEIDISVAEAAEAALDWLKSGDTEGCMTRFHSRWSHGADA
ncbi:Peptidyl-tRNA hydrolase [Planctomycetes bacterium Pla163]|uniref:Peptidyl-tRNA hydrolase n=1 Tax=Rohdeia mirabilis TaxID=2528008 RepID=A0A518D304_9BACT|nr:Peptidyl-tRNA hydrolase [Planctomycetes bacterium Pla163]